MSNQRRRLTLDFKGADPDQGTARFYTTEQLGPKRSLTPEGFLLCEDVPLARPGEMIYGPDETPIEAGPDGITHITRTLDELFKPETLASFNGKPVTNEHPDEDVTPSNWKRYAVGVLLNVRKGTGDNEGLMVGDMLITDPETIEDIRGDKREVSLGYDADYKKTGPGKGEQSNILGNHVALVERGRCGPRCAIHDHDTQTLGKENDMGTQVNGAPRRRLSSDAVRRVLDNAMMEMERMEGGEQTSLSKDEDGFGQPLTGEGLQHMSWWSMTYQADYDAALARGLTIGHEGQINGPNGRFVYFDTDQEHAGTVVELSDVSGTKMRFFDHIRRAAVDWDGSDPIRPVK